jgi:hypothetical protein
LRLQVFTEPSHRSRHPLFCKPSVPGYGERVDDFARLIVGLLIATFAAGGIASAAFKLRYLDLLFAGVPARVV